MHKKWDKMDRMVWDNSEVMQEYEKHVIELALRLDKFAQEKIASNVSEQAKDLADASRTITQNVPPATQATKEFSSALGNLSEDGEAEEESSESEDDISIEQYSAAKDSLLEELLRLSYDAADKGNIKLAYKIERRIYELEEEFSENL